MTLATAVTGYAVGMEIMDEGPGPLREVHEGMTVIDSDGEELGTVTELKMGDAEAATEAGQEEQRRANLIGTFAQAVRDGPDMPDQAAARLLRLGYFRVDVPLARDCYVAADQIERVDSEQVRLSVTAEKLIQRE